MAESFGGPSVRIATDFALVAGKRFQLRFDRPRDANPGVRYEVARVRPFSAAGRIECIKSFHK